MSRPLPQRRPVEAVDSARGNGHAKKWRRRRDWGGVVARVLCFLFAAVGLVPLGLGALVRLERVQMWAAVRTAELLEEQLGLDARYELDLRPWPLELSMHDVEIAASDGGGPALRARRIMARPRIFSLLAGKVDFGEVQIEEPELRVVIRDGKLMNVSYRVPDADGADGPAELPLSSVALTNALVDLTVDSVHVTSREIDVDLTLDEGPIELSLRAGSTDVDMRHPDPAAAGLERVDEDRVCHLELRARLAPDAVLVRRLELDGAADLDPAPGSRPGCDIGDSDWRRVRVEIASAEAALDDGQLEHLDGRLRLRAPVPLVHRFVDVAPTTGWVDIDLDQAAFDSSKRLPTISGRLRAADLGIDSKVIAHAVEASVSTQDDQATVHDLKVRWGGGDALIGKAVVEPFADGVPLTATDIEVTGVRLEDLLDDINVHPHAHVGWEIARATLDEFGGTLDPPALSGLMKAQTRDFAIYDRPTTDPHKRVMMAVDRGDLTGTFKVTPEAIVLSSYTLVTPRSRVRTTVSIGFDESFGLTVYEGSTVDLRDVSPLVDIEMAGIATVEAAAHGTTSDPVVEGTLSVDGFEFAGFGIGDIHGAKARFVPLELAVEEAKVVSGQSQFDVPRLHLDFDDGDADVVLHARADTRASGLRMIDFFRVLELDDDPAYQQIRGTARGVADIDYVLGGRRDRCGGGKLEVRGNMDLANVSLWGEQYDSGNIELVYLWDDIAAGDRGLMVDLRSGVLRKGTGSLIASGTITHGAKLMVDVVGTAIPLEHVDAFQTAFGGRQREDDPQRKVRPEADVSFVARVGGTLDRLEAEAQVDLSSMRIGPDVLPPSHLTLSIIPTATAPRPIGKTRCGNELLPAERPGQTDPDAVTGVYRLAGSLFSEQVRFDDIEITQQRHAMLSGKLVLNELSLGAFANLLPDVAFSAKPPRGSLSADVHIDELPLDDPGLAEIRMFVRSASISRAGTRLDVGSVAEPVYLSGDAVRIPTMPVTVTFPSGLRGTLLTGGTISHLSTPDPRLALTMKMDAVDLAQLGVDIPQVERAAGEVRAALEVGGTLGDPHLGGRVSLAGGMLRLRGIPLALDEMDVDIRISEDEVQIRRARARAGNTGMLSLNGRFPLRGLTIAGGSATLVARDVKLPLADGVKVTADAMLNASYSPASGSERELPNITGTVSLTQFTYTRPMSFSVDIDQLTGRRRTEVDTYNPDDELFSFDIKLVSPRPLRISNNLVDMRLDVTPPGIMVSGTNQRFGARGSLRIEPASKLFLQGHDFVVRDGTVTFDNPKRIAPKLDVHASTEYRRYAASSDAASATPDVGGAAGSAGTGGKWRIAMHAYGDTDEPKVRFTSDPPLSQDDIVLLLQVGMTRAELDRGLAGSLAQTVGIEAISAVTGLNQAVRKTLPLFDEVHVGSQYSSRSGRPEPTVSVGKRITDKVRATVTTGLSETREVRSNIEWKLSRGVSLTGSYDNVNDVSSSSLGNIGGDIRWRLEFE